MTTTKPIRKFTVEFMIIVVGVFIAVAAESWWSERKDRAMERDMRADMVEEFASNIKILEQDILTNETFQPKFDALTSMTSQELRTISDLQLEETYKPFPGWAGFDAEMGIALALVSSGNLAAISNPDLRLRISRWSGLMNEKDRKTKMAVEFQTQSLMPSISKISADGQWDSSERVEIQSLYATLQFLHEMVLLNQYQLLEEARSIHAYLSDTND